MYVIHPSLHGLSSACWCPMPLTSSLRAFLGYRAGSGILGYRLCWCPSPFPSPSISWFFTMFFRVFPSSPAIGFHSCFFDPSFTHFLGEFPGLGLAPESDVVVPEAEQRVYIEHKSSS